MPDTATVLPTPSSDASPVEARGGLRRLALPINISIGFLGIQFAWAIQMGQMSPLLESLGSVAWLTSLIWAAGPVTGVFVQPIVGALSDNFRSALGRRRPFLIVGAICTAIALISMPNSPNLLTAALLLWLLDASINLTQGPYRALVPDVAPREQQTTAYSLMSLTIGLGSVLAFVVAFFTANMHALFYMGAAAMVLAMGWTVLTVREAPSNQTTSLVESMQPRQSVWKGLLEMFSGIRLMPQEALRLCAAHSFTWFGLMCLFVFFSVYVPKQVFGGMETSSPLYQDGVHWASLCFAVLNAVCFLFSGAIGKLCRTFSKKATHTTALVLMALSFISLFFLKTPVQVMIAMGVIGLGWATTLSIPFALLTDHLPKGREGMLLGTFNIFIAAPGVLCSFLVGPIVSLTGGNEGIAFLIGGASILVSALLLQFVKEIPETGDPTRSTALPAGH